MNNAVRRQLCSCQQSGSLDALHTLCEELLNTSEDVFVQGCCLWNLSDIYAMRRDAESLYKNHLRFASHLEALPPMYRLWLVSDATQRLTLEQGSFGDAWWQWYSDATSVYNPACEVALFNAHRAAFYKASQLPYDPARADVVNDRFCLFLGHTETSEAIEFYRLIYLSLCAKHFGASKTDITISCELFLKALSQPPEPRLFAVGEWDAINTLRSKAWQAQVSINAAVHALIDGGYKEKARELYATACAYGFHNDIYIEQRL